MQWVFGEGQIGLLGGGEGGKAMKKQALNKPIVRNAPLFTFSSLATCCRRKEDYKNERWAFSGIIEAGEFILNGTILGNRVTR